MKCEKSFVILNAVKNLGCVHVDVHEIDFVERCFFGDAQNDNTSDIFCKLILLYYIMLYQWVLRIANPQLDYAGLQIRHNIRNN